MEVKARNENCDRNMAHGHQYGLIWCGTDHGRPWTTAWPSMVTWETDIYTVPGHVDVCSLCCLWELSLGSWFCSSRGPWWSPDLCCHWRLFGYLWSVLLPPPAPYWCTWPVLPWRPCCCRRLMMVSVICTPDECKGQGSYLCSGIPDQRLTVEKQGQPLPASHHPKVTA